LRFSLTSADSINPSSPVRVNASVENRAALSFCAAADTGTRSTIPLARKTAVSYVMVPTGICTLSQRAEDCPRQRRNWSKHFLPFFGSTIAHVSSYG